MTEIKISTFREFKKILICGLLFFLIVPLFIMIFTILEVKKDKWNLGEEKLIHEWGLFSKNEQIYLVKDITEVAINQSFFGRIFKYGDVSLSIIGKRTMHIGYVKNPEEISNVLRQYIEKARHSIIQEALVN
ncbi:MAG: PH domain-containing protein [Bacilli bacterium]